MYTRCAPAKLELGLIPQVGSVTVGAQHYQPEANFTGLNH